MYVVLFIDPTYLNQNQNSSYLASSWHFHVKKKHVVFQLLFAAEENGPKDGFFARCKESEILLLVTDVII